MDFTNMVKLLSLRKIDCNSNRHFERTLHVTDSSISRIGLEVELEGHHRCVNCLEWNEKGTLLLSGSDDLHIILWDPFRHKKLQCLQTGHYGNIFSVKFLPDSGDKTVVSGAADCKVRTHNLISEVTTHVYNCHSGRVKRIATSSSVPHMFWSAGEDGLVMQFDMRCPHECTSSCSSVLINLLKYVGDMAEAKCLSINPMRPEMLAVGANDPYVRVYDRRMIKPSNVTYPPDYSTRSAWERHDYVRQMFSHEHSVSTDNDIPHTSAGYFVPGHLPYKLTSYRKKHRMLASTYLTFSPDGTELLVNLGGEQIYLYNVMKPRHPRIFKTELLDICDSKSCGTLKDCGTSNGFCYKSKTSTNGYTTNGVSKHIDPVGDTSSGANDHKYKHKSASAEDKNQLPENVDKIKLRANLAFEKQQYTLAISLYNEAVKLMPEASVLYANKAAALMKRQWDGDVYSAMNCCYRALKYDPHHLKAHFRLARCLYELQRSKEAAECLQLFKKRFPEYSESYACTTLDRDIKAAIFSKTDCDDDSHNNGRSNSTGGMQRKPVLSEQEERWRSEAYDYQSRFCGHCNTTTDIKEANFFGSNGQYIVAGSDDGSFFVWDKKTSNIKRILRGDGSIVNCLQPHPSYCLLASSGIDPVVRLWSPKPEDGQKNEREVLDLDSAATDNQKRMNADPLEVMLMNMGYRISSSSIDTDDSDSRDSTERCRPS